MKRGRLARSLAIISVLFVAMSPQAVFAQLSSPNYTVEEAFFGTGGELDASSANYKAKQAAGETGVGNTTSTNYQSQPGFNTNREEYIEFIVNPATIDVGYLTTGSATTTTTTFSVKAYLAGGYVVRTVSDPPSNGNHTLTNLTSPTASSPGTEQFGINLVANSSPSVGSAPVQIPDASFSFGTASTGYNTANLFKYVKGDIVAEAPKSSGQTNYTVSYLYNVAGNTPDGAYVFNHVLVATATY